MRITGLDLETTGLDLSKGHRIIEIALLSFDSDTKKPIEEFVKRVDPERSIDPGASDAHGIVYTDVAGCAKFADIASDVHRILASSDLVVIHNAGFDAPFIASELLDAGLTLPELNIFCTMENARWATPNGKFPKLGELCFSLGVSYDEGAAHSADYDTSVMMNCFFKGVARGFYKPKGLV